MSLLEKVFGNYTKQNKKNVQSIVKKTLSFEEEYASITTSQRKKKVKIIKRNFETNEKYYEEKIFAEEEYEFYKITTKFKVDLRNGKTIEDIMPQALALCREASKRRLGITQYPVQLEAAIAMQDNTIAEMKTGEGKTYVQTLSAYLNALEATKSLDSREWKSVHVLTSNDYLAQRDKNENEKVFKLLGLTTGYAIPQSEIFSGKHTREEKKKEYDSDIVYGTAKTVAFDYLDDNHIYNENNLFLRRPLHRAIIDEADDILLDQATKPLILSHSIANSDKLDIYEWATRFINGEPGYRNKVVNYGIFNQYEQSKDSAWNYLDSNGRKIYYDAKFYRDTGEVELSDELLDEINLNSPYLNAIKSKYFRDESESVIENVIANIIKQCIYAKAAMENGKQYQVLEDEKETQLRKTDTIVKVVLTNQLTGRSMSNTTYSNGLQEAIEAKEAYFLEKEQLGKTGRRKILMYSTEDEVFGKCTYPDFIKIYEDGICGMTGTSDAEDFYDIYGLNTYEVPTRLPNIRKDEKDELYISENIKFKAILKEILNCQKTLQPVLVGTTCVRESDKFCKLLDEYGIRYQRLDAVNSKNEDGIKKTAGLLGMVTVATNMAGRGIDIKLGPGVEEVGGLYVIGSSKNKSKRVDDQLRGRTARQGQPGKTKYFMSLDDELVRIRYSGDTFKAFKKLYKDQETKINNRELIKIVGRCQVSEESHKKLQRRQSETKEELVFTRHKNIIYKERKKVLRADNQKLSDIITTTFKTYIDDLFNDFDQTEVNIKLGHLVDIRQCFDSDKDIYKKNILNSLNDKFNQELKANPNYFDVVKIDILKIMDDYWISHMYKLEDIWRSCTYSHNSMQEYVYKSVDDLKLAISYIKNEIITYALNPSLEYGNYVVKEVNISKAENQIESSERMVAA